jgi:hypothetical protein
VAGPLVALAGGPRAPHPLHDAGRLWPETSCYADLWIELLAALGHPPEAALGFAAAVTYEGDQFTFLKPPLADLEALFGLRVVELALFEGIEPHVAAQLARGRLVLLEVDAFHLPDTRATTWHREHAKTTIAVTALDPDRGRLAYVHNAGWFEVEGVDADGLLRRGPGHADRPDLLPPYAELVERRRAPGAGALARIARERLAVHLASLPEEDPIEAWRADLPGQLDRLLAGPLEAFHRWAFNLPRQLGAAFELLASHLHWLAAVGAPGGVAAIEPCLEVAREARLLQLQLARAVHRRRPVDPGPFLDRIHRSRASALAALRPRPRPLP